MPDSVYLNIRSTIVWLLMLSIRAYRLVPKRGQYCIYHPTCSAYALEALRIHGAARGLWLTLRRLGRCHPWGTAGVDPVPPRHDHRPPTYELRTPPAAVLAEE